METGGNQEDSRQNNPEVTPPLIELPRFPQVSGISAVKASRLADGATAAANRVHSAPISIQSTKRVLGDHSRSWYGDEMLNASPGSEPVTTRPSVYYPQPIAKGMPYIEASSSMNYSPYRDTPPMIPKSNSLRDTRFNSFRTRASIIGRQFSFIWGERVDPEPTEPGNVSVNAAVPVDRYFDALEGPELDTLRASSLQSAFICHPSEEPVLPEDRLWPFLLRYPISSFGICLGTSSQAILWKNLATGPSIKFLHISLAVNYALWCISIAIITLVASIYSLKMIIYFEATRREYYHPVRVNFFFAPWIALLFLAMGVPPSIANTLPHALWYVLMTPIFFLELKIYGQWMSGGQRRLSKVANPSNHLSIVGNFVGALLGASMGLKEGPIFFFAVGLAHYTVLFVTLYQRLPTNETLPKELHPVFFLFVAAPSVASMAWARLQGSFDNGSRIVYFIALFLYFSLVVRVNFFRGFRFSIAWWAYTFPMTGAAIATIRYANEVNNVVTRMLAVVLSGISSLAVTCILLTTVFHAFVLRDLFPNDVAIAISNSPPQPQRWFHLRDYRPEPSIGSRIC
ncbi:S-type anion channel SLAH3-like protein [Drosera capensis]